MATSLLVPILDKGIQSTHFFNGRLLAAEDLRQEQDANRLQRQMLGQAIGEGVVSGLEVSQALGSAGSRTVAVTSGLAINRAGQALRLAADETVELVVEPDRATDAGLFAPCDSLGATATPTGTGVYVLTIAPASGFEGQAPVSGLSTGLAPVGCGSRYEVQGVQFRLVALNTGSLTIPGDPDTLRNRLAHFCFGTEIAGTFVQDPFDPLETYGPLDERRDSGDLTDCDVPLALVYWSTSSIQFVDMWSVRRRPVPSLAPHTSFTGLTWPLAAGQRRLAEAEAMFLQFQEHLVWLADQGVDLSTIAAQDYFRYLPAAGFLPVGEGGIDIGTFFGGIAYPYWLDEAFLRRYLQQSWFAEPIDLNSPPWIQVYGLSQGDYAFFARLDQWGGYLSGPTTTPSEAGTPAPTGPTPAPAGPTSEPPAGTGRIDIAVSLPGKPLSSIDLLAKVRYRIWATDTNHIEYEAVPAEKRLGPRSLLTNQAHFAIRDLAPGTYVVQLSVLGFMAQKQQVTVAARQAAKVNFTLVKESRGEGEVKPAPGARGDAGWIGPGWYHDLTLFEPYLRWPWPPEEWQFQDPAFDPIPDDWHGRDPVTDPMPEEVDTWLKQYAGWLQENHPGAPVDPGDIQVYVSPDYVPGAVTDTPYAYVVFGPGGAYVPAVLTPTADALDHPVSVRKAGLAGMDPEAVEDLDHVGVKDVEVMAAGWRGLVADATGVSLEIAGTMMSEAREKVGALQDSLQVLSGVDADLETALREAGGIAGTIDLANADPGILRTKLAEAGVDVPLALVQRMVYETRQVVPRSAWSLAAGGLELKEQEVAALAEHGIHTLGDWVGADKEIIGGALGIGGEQVGLLTNVVEAQQAAARLETTVGRKASGAVLNLTGISKESGTSLAHLGFGTIGSLATAEPDAVAVAFGGDAVKAGVAIAAAKEEMAAIRTRFAAHLGPTG